MERFVFRKVDGRRGQRSACCPASRYISILTLAVCCLSSYAKSQAATAQVSAQNEGSAVELDKAKFPPGLLQDCHPSINFRPVQGQDKVAKLFHDFKHYRLVVGAGDYQDNPDENDRKFVAPTAAQIDARLDAIGYEELPDLKARNDGVPYLEGKHATKAAVRKAIEEMAVIMNPNDFAIIYYIGHGNVAPSHSDISLGVYDKPVSDDDGVRLSDIIGILETQLLREHVNEIPHIIIVLEACHSGIGVPKKTWTLVSDEDVQSVHPVQQSINPPQIEIISATGPGSTAQAFGLNGTDLSAFGFFFLRAFAEDWECADQNKDGIITVKELVHYLKKELELASNSNPPATDGLMIPRASDEESVSFIAYSASRHAEDGDFDEIAIFSAQPPDSNLSVTVTAPNGSVSKCSYSSPCSIPIFAREEGSFCVESHPISDQSTKGTVAKVLDGIRRKRKPCSESEPTSDYAREDKITLDELRASKGRKVVAGIPIQLQ